MRKIFLFFIFIFFLSQFSFAIPIGDTTAVDTSKKENIVNNKKANDNPVLIKYDTVEFHYVIKKGDSIKVSFNSSDSTTAKNCGCIPHNKTNLDLGEWLLVFVPLIIFLLIFFTIGRQKDFAFKDALTENEQTKQTIGNSEYTANNLKEVKDSPNPSVLLPPTVEITSGSATYRPSISRYIAFITSMLTLIVALAMSSFFIYHYISIGCPPDLSALSIILIALGIGVAPYAFNKVSTALKNKSE